MVFYELVNLNSGNRIGEYDTEEEALQDVRTMVARDGDATMAAIGLGQLDETGEGKILAEGQALAQRAAAVPV